MTQALARPTAGSPERVTIVHRLLVLVAIAVSLLFLYSGVEKWSDIDQFERIVVSHGLIDQTWAGPSGTALASIELGLGAIGLSLVLLTGPRSLAPVFLAQALMFLGFAVYAGLLAARPPPEPTSCGCGMLWGPTADWPSILTRNTITAAALGVAALLVLRSNRHAQAGRDAFDRSLTVAARQ